MTQISLSQCREMMDTLTSLLVEPDVKSKLNFEDIEGTEATGAFIYFFIFLHAVLILAYFCTVRLHKRHNIE